MRICKLPGNLSSSFCLFCHLIEFCNWAICKHLSFRRVQPMKGSLCMCPFKLTFFLAKIFLSGKGNLQKMVEIHVRKMSESPPSKSVHGIYRGQYHSFIVHTLCSITRSQALPLRAYRMKNLIKSSGK